MPERPDTQFRGAFYSVGRPTERETLCSCAIRALPAEATPTGNDQLLHAVEMVKRWQPNHAAMASSTPLAVTRVRVRVLVSKFSGAHRLQRVLSRIWRIVAGPGTN
jgi:hypothetical protein